MMIHLLFILSFASAQESFVLSDGTKVLGYTSEPPIKPKAKCPKYALIKKGDTYEFLSDGVKMVPPKSVLMIKDGCIFPRTGRLQLKDGKFMSFYQEDIFSEEGELAFLGDSARAAPDGEYVLKTGTKFKVTKGHLEDLGIVCGEDICFPNPD